MNNYAESNAFKEQLEIVKSRLESNEQELNVRTWKLIDTEKRDETISILKARERIKELLSECLYDDASKLSLEVIDFIIKHIDNATIQIMLPLRMSSDLIIALRGEYTTLFDTYEKTKEERDLLDEMIIQLKIENSDLLKQISSPEYYEKEKELYEKEINEKVKAKKELFKESENEFTKKIIDSLFRGYNLGIKDKTEFWKKGVLTKLKEQWILTL